MLGDVDVPPRCAVESVDSEEGLEVSISECRDCQDERQVSRLVFLENPGI